MNVVIRPTPRVLAALYGTPWAIEPTKLEQVAAFLRRYSAGVRLSLEELQAGGFLSERADAGGQAGAQPGLISVIPLVGTIVQRRATAENTSGGGLVSMERTAQLFRAALDDPRVAAIVFDVDSPGGTINGVMELADEIFAAREKKAIVAVANGLAASAAYWLASSAGELVVTPSGDVGSIGVYAMHEDQSAADAAEGYKVTLISAGRHKTAGNPWEPLTEDARALMQTRVDDAYRRFVKTVARNRATSEDAVRKGYGEGFIVGAEDAKREGMVDRIETLDKTIARLASAHSRAAVMRKSRERALTLASLEQCL
jgi:signal peptide peptidase SppA